MARVSFSALIEEILGKLAGSVFQDSYGGYQLRTRVTPRNPQTNYQQLRRGEFGFISQLWRTMSDTERETFITAAAGPSGGFNLFIQANVNLTLVNEELITTYIPSDPPDPMPIAFEMYSPGLLSIIADSALTVVPAGHSLLIQATYEKLPTKIFTNPSQFSPIIELPAGTDISTATNIAPEWMQRFGIMREGYKICIKSCLINISNGSRTDTEPTCATSANMLPFDIYAAEINLDIDGNPVATEATFNTITGVEWVREGVGEYTGTLIGAFPNGGTFVVSNSNAGMESGLIYLRPNGDGQLSLTVTDNDSVPTDGILFKLTVIALCNLP